MKRLAARALLGFLALLAACGSSIDGPTANDIERSMAVDLPTGYEIRSVSLEAAENIGSEVQPHYRSRVLVELGLNQDVYVRAGEIEGKPLVRLVAEAGETISGIMITSAEPTADGWRIDVERTELPTIDGEAESQFGPEGFIVENSEAHQALIDAAEQARAQELSDLQDHFLGTWRSSEPMEVRGRIYERNDRRLGFELTLHRANIRRGRGTAKVYVFEDPADFVTAEFRYHLESNNSDEAFEHAAIRFTERVSHRRLRFFTNPRATWRLYRHGAFMAEMNTGLWSTQLDKDT